MCKSAAFAFLCLTFMFLLRVIWTQKLMPKITVDLFFFNSIKIIVFSYFVLLQ